MAINEQGVRYNLKSGDFQTLFYEHLGWNRYRTPLTVIVEGQTFALAPIAERNGMAALRCEPQGDGKIPEYRLRRKIEQEVTKLVQEHLIIFTDGQGHQQVWQWVKREQSKPAAYREHTFDPRHQSGEALVQKLRNIAFDLDEEEELTLTLVGARARKAFDVEKVTKKFYELFRKQHADFLKSIQGIELSDDQAWYTSVMLNRLMFIYFIQKKYFLDNDAQYLRTRLRRVQAEKGDGHFHNFYRYFLLRLFHEGLGKKPEERTPERNAELEKLLGRVPYLNGGIFAPHSLEERYTSIQIEDAAFERIFDFFDQYQWHLDERPLRDDREINPDVLGYIFEKYINYTEAGQKENGAYYTKEDITEYIGRNTILPYLFDAAQPECVIGFREDGSVWRLLRENPDRYIFDAVKKGVDLPLPANIEAGVKEVAKRSDWNRPAAEEYALPTEIWREVVTRRQRCAEVRAKLAGGDIHSINDLITYNLDIRQFAQDVLEQCEGPETLRAFWKALQSMHVLDPTVGSGAFLFAAMNILEPLYEAVLERMEAFVSDADRVDLTLTKTKFADFRKVLARIDGHPNRRHYIYKSIIINNLFGVDIMEEATEICKLRLFLKLVAQVACVDDLEPLPDIDFNIRAGNTLVGYAQIDDIERLWAATERLAFERNRDKLEMLAGEYALLLKDFRNQQLGVPVPCPISKKDVERAANEELRPELDKDLWRLYRTASRVSDKMTLAQFRSAHGPLHWFVEFPEVMAAGGFDVIIGNPPYVEYGEVKAQYQVVGFSTDSCNDLYAYVTEQAILRLSVEQGRIGLILPVSCVSTEGFAPLQKVLLENSTAAWTSHYAERPAKLFTGAEKRLSILMCAKSRPGASSLHLSKYHRWQAEERFCLITEQNHSALFERLTYVADDKLYSQVRNRVSGSIPKVGSNIERNIMCKLFTKPTSVQNYLVKNSPHFFYYTRKLRYFIQFFDFVPTILDERDNLQPPSELKQLYTGSEENKVVLLSALNSSLFFWFFVAFADCRNVNKREILAFPIGLNEMSPETRQELSRLSTCLMTDFKAHSRLVCMNYVKQGVLRIQTFAPRDAKQVIDEIDRVLARHYRFTEEEQDFIINYDIKYRMGRGSDDEGD